MVKNCNLKKIAVLISDLRDIDWVNQNFNPKEVTIYTRQAHLAKLIPGNYLHDFYQILDSEYEAMGVVERILQNWHRDSLGNDLSFFNGISWGVVLNSSLGIALPALFREIFGIIRIANSHDEIYVSKNEPSFIFEYVLDLSAKIAVFDPGHSLQTVLHNVNLRKVTLFPRNLFLFQILNLLQRPFIKKFQNKNIFINCWSSRSEVMRRNDSLLLNGGVNFLRSAYFSGAQCQKNYALGINEIKAIINLAQIKLAISPFDGINNERLLSTIVKLILNSYGENEKVYSSIYENFFNIFETYFPKNIVFPGYDFDVYLIAAQLAKYRKIRTIMCIDGIASVKINSRRQRHLLNKKLCQDSSYIYEKIITSGRSNLDIFGNAGVEKNRLTHVRPPLLSLHKVAIKKSQKFDLMIMTHTPYDYNLLGQTAYKLSFLMECLGAARMTGKKRVAIKVKHKTELGWVTQALEHAKQFMDITIIQGNFYMHVHKAALIVGGISTALFEAHHHSIPYIIYEPVGNGYTNEDISNSDVINASLVARTEIELAEIIRSNNTSIRADWNYIFSGKNLSEIDLDF